MLPPLRLLAVSVMTVCFVVHGLGKIPDVCGNVPLVLKSLQKFLMMIQENLNRFKGSLGVY